jgi:hypothetical protein
MRQNMRVAFKKSVNDLKSSEKSDLLRSGGFSFCQATPWAKLRQKAASS